MPLAYARRAGASAWTDEQREAFVDERKGQPRAATAGRAGGYHRTRPHTAPMPLTGDDWQTPTASHSQSLTPPRSSGSSPTAKAHKRSPTGTPCDGRRLRVQPYLFKAAPPAPRGAVPDTAASARAGHAASGRSPDPDAGVSDKDVTRVERAIRGGSPRAEVFPRLEEVATAMDGEGVNLIVHFTKKQGAAVRYVADESVPAAGIREVDLLTKYYRPPGELGDALGITRDEGLLRHLDPPDASPTGGRRRGT